MGDDGGDNALIASITEFVILTQASEGEALKFLSNNNGDLGRAVDAFFRAAERGEQQQPKEGNQTDKGDNEPRRIEEDTSKEDEIDSDESSSSSSDESDSDSKPRERKQLPTQVVGTLRPVEKPDWLKEQEADEDWTPLEEGEGEEEGWGKFEWVIKDFSKLQEYSLHSDPFISPTVPGILLYESRSLVSKLVTNILIR